MPKSGNSRKHAKIEEDVIIISFVMVPPGVKALARGVHSDELILTCRGLSFVNFNCYDSEFTFVCGRSRISVHPMLAEFLSPKAASLRKSDVCACQYRFKDTSINFYWFEHVIQRLQTGQPICVDQNNFDDLLRIFVELENDEALSSLLSFALMDMDKVLRILNKMTISRRCLDLVTTVASHFDEISQTQFDLISFETAHAILSNPGLSVTDEDSVYEFVRARAENDTRFLSLFEFVCFEYLSRKCLEDFALFAEDKLLGNFSPALWRRICSRLLLTSELENGTPARQPSGKKFTYKEESPFDGIITYLQRMYTNREVVHVTSSTFWRVHEGDHSNDPKNVIDFARDTSFRSKDTPQSWICLDFKDRRVTPFGYTIRGDTQGSSHLKSWVLEASNDKQWWTVIDRQNNNKDLDHRGRVHHFQVRLSGNNGFRYVRLRETGKNHSGTDVLALSALEIFGFLSDN